MKKKYDAPEMEMVEFAVKDIITVSGLPIGNGAGEGGTEPW